MLGRPLSVGVIGAGIGGVAAAVALHRAGIQATVYERAAELREAGSGLMLWPNGARVLKHLRLLDQAAALSGSSDRFLVRGSSGKILMDIGLGRFDVPAICTRRSDLLGVLLSALPPDAIRTSHEFDRFEESRNAVRIHFAGGISAEHDIVIGADGIRSRVRSQHFEGAAPVYRGYTIWRGLGRLPESAASGANTETWGRGNRFGILHTGGDRFTWYATANTEPGHVDSAEGRQRELLRTFAGWHDPVERLIESTPESAILKHGAYDLPPLKQWAGGRIALLGDAAHALTPNLGQGGCMALEDAMVLAKSFGQEVDPVQALRRYESLRRGRTGHVQQRSWLMGYIGQWENSLMSTGRDMVTNLLPPALFERNLRRLYSYAA